MKLAELTSVVRVLAQLNHYEIVLQVELSDMQEKQQNILLSCSACSYYSLFLNG